METHTSRTLTILTNLIVENALEEKACSGLIAAYRDEVRYLCEMEGGDLQEALANVSSQLDCERVMSEEFVRVYKELTHTVSTETCLEVFEFPYDLSDGNVPLVLLLRVGQEMARRDARMANALRTGKMSAMVSS